MKSFMNSIIFQEPGTCSRYSLFDFSAAALPPPKNQKSSDRPLDQG
ncbi:hypothetical protein [Chryseobacterium shandongense]|nr:hypothetical protein [Chryseobacterium shandongense]